MKARDFNALTAVTEPELVTLPYLAARFSEAVEEAQDEGLADPSRDPAVMLFGALIAFHTHADVNSVNGFHQLIELCRERYHTELGALH